MLIPFRVGSFTVCTFDPVLLPVLQPILKLSFCVACRPFYTGWAEWTGCYDMI
jgi:hypothetical protein